MAYGTLRRVLSAALCFALLVSALSAGFAAFAAADPYQALADALRAEAYSDNSRKFAAAEAYWEIAKGLHSKRRSPGAANNTPQKIRSTILRNLLIYMPLEALNEAHAMEMLTQFSEDFTLERSRDEALLSGAKNISQIPNELSVRRSWTWVLRANGTLRAMRAEDGAKNVKALKRALKTWENTFSKRFLHQNLSRRNSAELDAMIAKINKVLDAAKTQDVTNNLLRFYGLPTFIEIDVFHQQIAQYQALMPYRNYAEKLNETQKLNKLSQKQLQSKIIETRTNIEALQQLSRTDLTVFEKLSEEYTLDFDAAQEYIHIVAQALTENDAHDLVAIIAKAIQGEAPYPAMTWNASSQTYTFSAAGLTFEQILALYERVVLADAALTGSIAGVPNFPGYNVAARLNAAHGIAVANAPARAISAIRVSLNGYEPRLLLDYSAVPAGSGWTANLNFDPAPAESAALAAAGGPLLSDPGFPPYERMPSSAPPGPVKINPDGPNSGANLVNTPVWSIAKGAPEPAVSPKPVPPVPPVDGANDPGWPAYQTALDAYNIAQAAYLAACEAHAKWQFTQAIYGWIDAYESNDYPAVPNTAAPPADNSSRENDAFPINGTYAQKYEYINNLQQRFQLEIAYLSVLDEALRQPESAYYWLQTKWNAYTGDPNEATREDFLSAARRYYSMLESKQDGTYANKNGAYVPNGLNELIAGYKNALQKVDIVTIYGAFFNTYRLNLQPEDFARYSDENLRTELAAVDAKIRQFARDNPGESVPTAWSEYLETMRQAIFLRVFDEINSLSGDAEQIALQYDRNTLLSNVYPYNLSHLDLWQLIESVVSLTPAQQTQLTLAQQVLARLRDAFFRYETLHWELIAGEHPQYYEDWLPTRGLDEPIVLQVGQDEFHVKYEHVENMINKLDTILTSEWFYEKMSESQINLPDKLISGTSGPSDGLSSPRFHLPKLDGAFLSRLGQMRTSSGELEITDPRTGVKITLPPLETQRNTARFEDKAAGIKAERRWIQAYRADVLLYLLRWVFEAVNTGETGGLEMLSWIIYQIVPPQHTVTLEFWDGEGNLIDRPAEEIRVTEGMEFELPAELKEPFERRKIVGEDGDFIDYEIANYVFKNHSHDGSAIYEDTLIALYFDRTITHATLERTAIAQTQALVREAVPQAMASALETVDLSAAVTPFLTEVLAGAVSQNLIGDKLPNTILGLYQKVAEATSPLLEGPLLRRPGDTSGRGLIDDLRFAALPRIDLTLGYMLEQIAGRSRYSITVNDLLAVPAFQEVFDFGGAQNWLELMLGAQITTQEMVKNWPEIWPKSNGTVPAGAPAYVQKIAENLSEIYRELSASDAQFPNANFAFGLEKIEDYAEQRQAFEDVMAFAMGGLAYFFSAVFSESELTAGQVQGNQNDFWYNDLIVGLEGVTRKINDMIQGALRIFNAPLELLGLPPIEFSFTLPDVRVGNYVGDRDYFDNRGEVHWRGQFDGRVGVTSKLSAVNAYGRIFIPLFELLGIDRQLIQYSETEFNQEMAALATRTSPSARENVSRALMRALVDPIMNWLAPIDEAQIPLSLGYRPVGKLLDLLPNLAYVTENGIIPKLVNSVLDDLTLDVTLHLGGGSGDPLNGLVEPLADYVQFDVFEMNYFLELFVNILPELLGAGPLLTRILETAGIGMAWIFAIPMAEIVQLPAGSYAKMFRNRNDGNGTSAANEDDFLTILEGRASTEPGAGVRPATLAALAGFFGGDAAAQSLNFKLFGENGLALGKILTSETPLLGYVQEQTGLELSGDINAFVDSASKLFVEEVPEASAPVLSEDPAKNEQWLRALDKITQNGGHATALLVELFNPQTYPARDYMNYALLDKAQSRDRVLNEVQYSKTWTRKMADRLTNDLPEFLDHFSAYCFDKSFLDWLYDRLKADCNLDLRALYTAENLDGLLRLASKNAGKFLRFLGLKELANYENSAELQAKVAEIQGSDRAAFIEVLVEILQPAAPVLRALLIGGWTSDVPWFGAQYANNGVDFDPAATAPGLGRAGDNITILNDYIGVSGYDGYKHGVIPILEAFGVPQRDILPHKEFVERAENNDEAFFKMLLEPLLGVVDRVVADPIGELPQTLANMIYFLAAEGGNEKMTKDPSAQNGFIEAVNRMFRPMYAALDMATPLVSLKDAFALLGVKYPFTFTAGDAAQDVFLAPDLSLNSIVTGLARRWFAGASDHLGLELTLALQDIMDMLTGELKIFRSVNGQNDAVRIEIDRADLFTTVARRLITLTFSEENWAEMRLFIAARLPANTRSAALYLLDALADMVRGMEPGKAADLTLAVLFHLFLAKDDLIKKLFALREFRDRLIAFFKKLSLNDALGPIAVLAGATLAAGAAVPIGLAGLGVAVLGGLGLTGLAAWLFSRDATHETAALPKPGETADSSQENTDMAGYVKPPKTGDSYAIVVGASIIGGLALLGAALTLKKRRKYA
jgi:hypothetical protein